MSTVWSYRGIWLLGLVSLVDLHQSSTPIYTPAKPSMIVGPYGIGYKKATGSRMGSHDSSSLISVLGKGQLNQDILMLIVKCISDDEDILSFMSSCRLFHALGTPELFRDIVTLYSTDQLESFHTFMMSGLHDFPHQFRHLRKLSLNIQLLIHDPSHADMLADILSAATHLTMLEIHNLDHILDTSTRVATAMTNLSNLIILVVGNVRERGVVYLTAIKSPLRGLSVGLGNAHRPIQVAPLGACASSLSFLEVRPGTVSFQPIEMVFPRVETLRLPINDCVSSTSIFRSFPSLKRLDVCTMDDNISFGAVRDDHEANVAKLALYGGPLPNLETLVGDPYGIYQSALYCPVKKLLADVLDEERANRALLPLIRRCRPSTLRIHIDVYQDEGVFDFLGAFFAEVAKATELKEFWLIVAASNTFEKGDSLEDFINDLPRRMAPLPIQSLSVNFLFPACFEHSRYDWNEFVSNFDLHSWAFGAAKTIPTLREVIIFSMAYCAQVRYEITVDEDEKRSMTIDTNFDGPWSFGFSYHVEEIPFETTCMLRPWSSTSRATFLGIEPSIGLHGEYRDEDDSRSLNSDIGWPGEFYDDGEEEGSEDEGEEDGDEEEDDEDDDERGDNENPE